MKLFLWKWTLCSILGLMLFSLYFSELPSICEDLEIQTHSMLMTQSHILS